MKNTSKKIYSLAFVLVSGWLQAQENFPDDVQDVPVDTWIIPMTLLGLVTMFYFIKKREQIK